MYVTWSDLISFVNMLCAIITLIIVLKKRK